MTIEWLCSIPNCTLEHVQKSSMASLRMRAGIAAEAASNHGYEIAFSDGHGTSTASIIFVTKIDLISDPSRARRWESYLKNSSQNGTKIIIDYTDHHLTNDTPVSYFYKKILPIAHKIICSSKGLAEHIELTTASDISIIEDPIEVELTNPKIESSTPITGLWFGHASNLSYLINYLLEEYKPEHKYRLILMSNSYPLNERYLRPLSSEKLQSLEIHALPWSLSNMIDIAKISDFCLLPTGVNDPRKNGASSNRLITALALGLPVAADTIDSYIPFKEYYTELRTIEFENLISNPNNYTKKILVAQNIISNQLTKNAIEKHWIDTINSQVRSSQHAELFQN